MMSGVVDFMRYWWCVEGYIHAALLPLNSFVITTYTVCLGGDVDFIDAIVTTPLL